MAMKDGKIVVARLWHQYKGGVPSRTPVILGINPQKYQTIFIYLMGNSDEPSYFELKGYKTFYISRKKNLRIFNLWTIWKLTGVLKQEKVDILHCHLHKASVYGAISARVAGVPVVFSHVHGLNRSKSWQRKLINRLVLRKVNKIFAVGESVRKDVLESNPFLSPEKVVSLGNSIDYGRYNQVEISKQQAKEDIGLKADSFVFGTIGRLTLTKGYSYLIEAFAQLKEQIPSAHLIFVGEGRLQNELEQQAAETPYADSIHFLGPRSDITSILKAIDVFVLSSIAEGLPRSLLEAMAARVPCIGTKVGGIPEILADGEFGYLVSPKDDDALAEAMMKIANISEQEREKLIKKAWQRVADEYSHETVRKKLENIYETEYKTVAN
jgi:glycosyltransferase involved in cell wall biosynthesis